MTTQQKIEFLTPVGRIVAGDPFKANTKDAEGRPLVVKNGPNAGQPRVEYYIGVAIPKTDMGYNELYEIIYGAARAAFPNMFDAAGACINPKFSFKLTDGDSTVPNTKGIAPCAREGYKGHWIVNLSNGFPPKCYTQNGDTLITDPAMLKKGYYVRVYGDVKSNGSLQQPGVFLNFSMIELVGYGEEIHSGPDGAAVFGGKPAGILPAGASATPIASTTTLAQPPAASAGVPQATPPASSNTQMVAPPDAAPAQTPAPAQDFLNPPASTPAPNVTPTPAPAPAGPAEIKYLHEGVGYTQAQLTASGWTEAQITSLSVKLDDEIPF